MFKSALVFVLAMTSGMTFSSPSLAQAIRDPVEVARVARGYMEPARRGAVRTTALTPAAGSALVFPALELDMLADGSRVVRGVSVSQKRKEERLVFFEVDPESETYRTFLPEDLPEGPQILARLRRQAASNRRPIRCVCPFNSCSGSWTVSVTTLDPVFVELTETTGDADWSYDAMCHLSRSTDTDCWAANPSSLGTHWYESSCTGGNFGAQGMIDYNAQGNFYNWDFGFNNLQTLVTQNVRIRLLHEIGVVATWSHTDSGEGSSLIYGSLFETGGNDCF